MPTVSRETQIPISGNELSYALPETIETRRFYYDGNYVGKLNTVTRDEKDSDIVHFAFDNNGIKNTKTITSGESPDITYTEVLPFKKNGWTAGTSRRRSNKKKRSRKSKRRVYKK